MKNKYAIGNPHKENTILWVCYVTNVRKRRFLQVMKHDTSVLGKEIYGLIFKLQETEEDTVLTQQQIDYLYTVSRKVPTSVLG